jgi:hypothetical protein
MSVYCIQVFTFIFISFNVFTVIKECPRVQQGYVPRHSSVLYFGIQHRCLYIFFILLSLLIPKQLESKISVANITSSNQTLCFKWATVNRKYKSLKSVVIWFYTVSHTTTYRLVLLNKFSLIIPCHIFVILHVSSTMAHHQE